MAAVRHIGFVIGTLGPPTKTIWWSLSLVKIDTVVSTMWTSLYFACLVIHAPKMFFFGDNVGASFHRPNALPVVKPIAKALLVF